MRNGAAGGAVVWVAGLSILIGTLATITTAQSGGKKRGHQLSEATYRYRPEFRVPPSLEDLQKHLTAGSDAFPEEKIVEELAAEFEALRSALLQHPKGIAAATRLLAPGLMAGRLVSRGEERVTEYPQLEIFRIPPPDGGRLNRTALEKELTALVDGFASINVAEFLVTAIAVDGDNVTSIVRFDLSGPATGGGRAERIGRWRMRWRRQGPAWRVVEWHALEGVRSRARRPVFTEVTDSTFGRAPAFAAQLRPALDDWIARLDSAFAPGGMGHHGVSAGDANGDGLDDLFVSQPGGLPNRLLRNNGDGTFADITEAAGVAVLDSTSHSLFADIENDGDQDLVLVTRSEPLLFTNDGRGRFTHVPGAFQFAQRPRGSLTSAAMADYDRDGFLDLYLCAYSYLIGASEDKAGPPTPYHDARNGPPNMLFRNTGEGRFIEVTEAAGLNENNDRFSFAAAWADYDEDGWPDLLVANDFGQKNLYRNLGMVDGHVRFSDRAEAAGATDFGAGMSASFLDYDNDGRLDIYTGNMWSAAGLRTTAYPSFMSQASPAIRDVYRRHTRGNSLFRNRGDGTYDDVTVQAGAEFGRWAWSSDAIDFDSDGWEDLYIANGMFTRDAGPDHADIDSFFWRQVTARSPLVYETGTSYDDAWRLTNRLLVRHGVQASHERNVLLRNNGRGGFDEISGTAGLDLDQDGRSFAILDYDADGDPDVATMAARSAPQLRLFRNDFAVGHAALAVRLVGTKSNRDAVGARVTVATDLGQFTRIVKAGSGFISQHSKELLFGLGKSTRVVKLVIHWPSGLVQTLGELAVNQRIRVTEGNESIHSEPFRGPAPAQGAPPIEEEPPKLADHGMWLYQPYPAPDYSVRDLKGEPHSLAAVAGRPVVLLFWATWAPPSRHALVDLARNQRTFADRGVPILALSVDRAEDEPKVRAAATGLGVPVALAGEEAAGRYTLLHRYVFDRREDLRLPTFFLLNSAGEIAKVYHGSSAAQQVIKDLTIVDAPEADRLARALPFAGQFHLRPGERTYFQYGLELSEQGYDDAAVVAFERVAKSDPSAITFFNLGTLYMRQGRTPDARAALERSLQLEPENADANNSLGTLLAQEGHLARAIARFRAALASRPQFPDALNNLGYALFQTGDVARARELIEHALAVQPDFPEALNNLGIVFGSQRDLDRAMLCFQKALERRSSYGEAANNLALVLAARADDERAILVLKRLLEENPAFEMAYVTLSKMYLKNGRRQESTEVLQRLLKRNPTHPLGLQLLQQIQAGGG